MSGRERQGLGTFGGVFTPSILTILGIILFLRLGFVVGNAGLGWALVIILAATAVSVLTSISVAAIATNIEVKGGGDYYLISRTLGVEFGGAIGIVLFLAQSVSVGFYAIGFGESVAALAGFGSTLAIQAIAAGAVAVLFLLAWAGADVATRFQYLVMAALVAALVSFFIGSIRGADGGVLGDAMAAPTDSLGFWAVFAIFFPAVTGFTQGVSMSGDLRDPSRSLPLGTFAAVGLSTVVYVGAAILLAANATSEQLIADTRILGTVATVPGLIDAGVIAATLSSAMASFLGGPRILQSLAGDRIFPLLGYFAKGHGPSDNPRRGTVLTLGIAFGTIALGDLDAIAPVVSMFFLISYGLLNYATYYEARASSPAFRPRFRFFNRRTALAGALLCLGAMLAINLPAGIGAVLVLGAIYQYLARRTHPTRWADATHSHHFQRAKESIRALTGELEHSRHWRPQVLAFSADRDRRARLLTFATWLEGRSGLTAAIRIMEGGGAIDRREREAEEEALRAQILELGIDVHPRVILAPDAIEAVPVVVQSFGVGPLRANTALFGAPEVPEPARVRAYTAVLREVHRYGKTVVIVSTDEASWERLAATSVKARRIDVWWADDDSGRLALLSAYLCTRTAEWSRAKIRVVVPVPAAQDAASMTAAVEERVTDYRIPATVATAAGESGVALAAACRDSSLVILPIRLRDGTVCDQFGADLLPRIDQLPLVCGMLAGGPVDLSAGPESGVPGEVAAAEAAAAEARRRAEALQRRLTEIDREIQDLRIRAEVDRTRQPARALADAERRRESTRRRLATARAKEQRSLAELERLVGGTGA
ncbi:MAG: amino acid permease [Acidimicrobiia bacterium]|nr:amino acid permease [Acidimicrobiia bacterium]